MLDLSAAQLAELVLPHPSVSFADRRTGRPQPERAVRDLELGVNRISRVQRLYRELDGSGRTVSIKENAFDSLDIDLRERYVPSPLRDRAVTTHATTVASVAAGAGNSYYTGRGAAPGGTVSSSSFNNLFPDDAEQLAAEGAYVQNHSYGLGLENYYGGEAAAYDEQVRRLNAEFNS